jgi:hypothetical protein
MEAVTWAARKNYTQYGAMLSYFTDQRTNDLVKFNSRDALRMRKGQPDLNHCSGFLPGAPLVLFHINSEYILTLQALHPDTIFRVLLDGLLACYTCIVQMFSIFYVLRKISIHKFRNSRFLQWVLVTDRVGLVLIFNMTF